MTYNTELVELLPWTTRLRRPRPCDGYRWAHMSLRDARDPERRERHRCQHHASWRYVAARGDYSGKTGRYCWNHLVNQLEHMPDGERNNGWWNAHLDEVDALRARYGYSSLPRHTTT